LYFGKFKTKKFIDYYLKVKGLKKYKKDGSETNAGEEKGLAGYFALNKNEKKQTPANPAQ
jgi:hypothetical protein